MSPQLKNLPDTQLCCEIRNKKAKPSNVNGMLITELTAESSRNLIFEQLYSTNGYNPKTNSTLPWNHKYYFNDYLLR
jgi:hypothetical protein